MRLGTPAVAILPGVTSLRVSPAPLPGPGSGQPCPIASLAQGLDWLYVLDHAKPEKGHAWGSSLPKADFLPGVTSPNVSPASLPGPGSGLATPPSVSSLGVRIGCTCSTTLSPKRAVRGDPASP